MERYNKNNSADKCIKAVMLLSKLGIDVDIGFIMFDPSMSLDTLKHNICYISLCPFYFKLKYLSIRFPNFIVNTPTTSHHSATLDFDNLSHPSVHRQKLQYFHVLNLTIQLSLFYRRLSIILTKKKRDRAASLYQYYFPSSEHS